MKLIHLSDLHLGKRVNEYSMLEDQKFIIAQILDIIKEEQPDAVLLAGDIYDKAVPSAEAVCLFDAFLTELSGMKHRIFVISGNHDSAERIAFGSRLLDKNEIYLSPVYDGNPVSVSLYDVYGEAVVYLLPFVKPVHVRSCFPEETVESYTEAMRVAVNHMEVDRNKRNILVTHQFVTGASRCDSEDISVGGTDNVDASVFEPFDYVALGHLHGPQTVTRETIRYCGTPLKYSFSEKNQVKSVTVVELEEKGKIQIRTVPLHPQHDLRELRGTYEELMNRRNYEGTAVDDYLRIVLTDEEDIPDAVRRLGVIYPNIMKLEYDNKRTRSTANLEEGIRMENRKPSEYFADFYKEQNGQAMSETMEEIVSELFTMLGEN
ncbi:MAG: exonuclease SbcCD subunit D [Blautia sp.]|nr:exonuclease SbcCD subunit D [Blautia sp.]